MKKEWLCQLVALMLFYLDSIISVEHEGVFLSDTPIIDLLYLLYSAVLFLIVNYVFIPRFFHAKRYLLFFALLVATIVLFGIVEEELIEQLLSPHSRGANDLTWQAIYWYFGEILIPLLTFMTIKFVFDNFAQQRKLEKIEQNRLTNELRLLKSQIQPHLLFNSLNNLYHFALKKSDEVPDLILKLSNVLRYVLYETTEEKVPLEKELIFIKDFINLQEIQYKGRGQVRFDIEKEEDNSSLKIAPFMLIPFIENSFKHSFGSKIKEVYIEIKISIQKDQIRLFVKNNFEEDGGNSEKLTEGGIGLKNVKKRLALLYPNQYKLDIQKKGQEHFVNLNIKLA